MSVSPDHLTPVYLLVLVVSRASSDSVTVPTFSSIVFLGFYGQNGLPLRISNVKSTQLRIVRIESMLFFSQKQNSP